MAAHLHRYNSELVLLSDVTGDIKRYNEEFHQEFVDRGIRVDEALGSNMRGLEQITSQLSAISRFRDELQLKIDSVLALVKTPPPYSPPDSLYSLAPSEASI